MTALRSRRISLPALSIDVRQKDIDIAWDIFQSLLSCVPQEPPFLELREQLQYLDDAWEDLSAVWEESNSPPKSSKRHSASFHFSFPEHAQGWTSAHLDDLSEQLQKLHTRIRPEIHARSRPEIRPELQRLPKIRPELQRLRGAWDCVADELSNLLYDRAAYEAERSKR